MSERGAVLPGMLVDPTWLLERDTARAEHRVSDVVLADVRWAREGSTSERFERSHLPGAVSVDADADLAAPAFHGPGRHPLPEPRAFASTMSRLGIGDGVPVVTYDDAGGSVAARLWWMLRVLGHPVALLDLPSLDAWIDVGGGLETGRSRPVAPAVFTPRPWPADRVADAGEVTMAIRDGTAVVLDARAAERYRGDAEPIDPVAGHIPGAVSAPWTGNRVADGAGPVRDPAALRTTFGAMGVVPGANPIASCGSGLTATFTLFALERAGLGPGRLYEGSWSDWVSDPSRPVAIGDEPGGGSERPR